jgi:hypothetical protein
MPLLYLVRIKRHMGRNSLSGLLSLILLASVALGSLSCNRKSGSANSAPAGAASPVAESSPVEPMVPRKVFNTGEAVPAGYLGYKIIGSWFSDHISGKDGKQSAAGTFLYIDLAIVNTDKKERDVAAIKLVDESSKEYPVSEKAATVEGSLGQVGKVSPNQSKRAIAIFEAPKGHEYKLKIQGFSAADEVQITLTTGAAPPVK